MKLLADRCVRCGETRTRQMFEGLPTCEACEERLRSAQEEPRNCPDDGGVMRKELVLGVVIDRCPTCRGVWLDAGELKRVREGAAKEAWSQALLVGLAPIM